MFISKRLIPILASALAATGALGAASTAQAIVVYHCDDPQTGSCIGIEAPCGSHCVVTGLEFLREKVSAVFTIAGVIEDLLERTAELEKIRDVVAQLQDVMFRLATLDQGGCRRQCSNKEICEVEEHLAILEGGCRDNHLENDTVALCHRYLKGGVLHGRDLIGDDFSMLVEAEPVEIIHKLEGIPTLEGGIAAVECVFAAKLDRQGVKHFTTLARVITLLDILQERHVTKWRFEGGRRDVIAYKYALVE